MRFGTGISTGVPFLGWVFCLRFWLIFGLYPGTELESGSTILHAARYNVPAMKIGAGGCAPGIGAKVAMIYESSATFGTGRGPPIALFCVSHPH